MAELKIDITKAVEEIIEKLNAEGYTDVKHGKWEQGKCTYTKNYEGYPEEWRDL